MLARKGFTSLLFTLQVTRASAKAFATFLLLGTLVACSPEPSLEEQIVAVIETMEAHAEAGERRPFMTYVDESFQGQGGAMGRDEFRAFFVFQLSRYNRIEARLLPIAVTDLGSGLAGARFQALVTGANRAIVPQAGQLYTVDTTFIRRGREWKLVTADWTPVLGSS